MVLNRLAFAALLLAAALSSAPARAQLGRAEKEGSIQYLLALRNKDGGYRVSAAPGPSSVAATTNCLRALKYFGMHPDQRPLPFVNQCMREDGGIADTPDSQPNARSTAIGLMALVELQAALKFGLGDQIRNYLTTNAKAMPDVYLAIASLESANLAATIKPLKAKEWMGLWDAIRNPDGTYGKSPADTAGAAITALRLGMKVRDSGHVRRHLLEAQRPDGGWSADGQTSDMPTVYRVTRALWMLKAKPDLPRLRRFIASCRNPDGGYGNAPGQASSAPATYYCAICLHWADEMEK